MKIKKFICGLCKEERYTGTRHGLRKHLKEEHRIRSELANFGVKKTRQRWWITEDFE